MRSLVPISVLCAALAWLTPRLDAQDKRPAPPPPAPSETAGQENARESAQSYLEGQNFSRKGLIDQLKYEGFSTADATYAVDKVAYRGIWNEQAAGAAKDYLDGQSFSRSGLIQQLEYEGYTPSQAIYGVNQAYH